MNKIKYPEQRVIDLEIKNIIDNSGVFDDSVMNAGMNQTIKPAKSKKLLFHNLVSLSAAALALIVIYVGVTNGIKIAPKSIKPLRVVTDDETLDDDQTLYSDETLTLIDDGDEEGDDTQGNADDIEIKDLQNPGQSGMNAKITFLNPDTDVSFLYSGQSNGTNVYHVPMVHYKQEEIPEVQNYCEDNIPLFQKDLMLQFRSMVQTNDNIDLSLYDPSCININYDLGQDDSNINTGVLSLKQNNIVIYKNDDFYVKENVVKGINFDLNTRRVLTLRDIFDDYDAGMNEVSDYLQALLNNIYEKEENNSIIVNKWDVSDILVDGNWYFSNDGIMFPANAIYRVQKDEIVHIEYKNAILWVPFNQMPSLKEEYRNGK